jgi:hypothetical protein
LLNATMALNAGAARAAKALLENSPLLLTRDRLFAFCCRSQADINVPRAPALLRRGFFNYFLLQREMHETIAVAE